jgi:hypothetical protein
MSPEMIGEGRAPALPIGIMLPEDEGHILSLVAKRDEYKKRLNDLRYRAPDAPGGGADLELEYRVLILDTLFVEGSVDSAAILDELSQEPNYSEWGAEEAIRIIYDYCRTGGQGNVGGTGLREVPPALSS